MANCREIEQQLAAYVDGEDGAAERGTVEAHLQRCPSCRARAAAERASHDLLLDRRDGLRGCAPDALRRRCAAQRALAAGRPAGLFSRRTLARLSMAAALVLATALYLMFGWGTTVETYAAQLAADHLKCFQFPPDSRAADAAALGRTWQAANGWPLTVAASMPAERLELLGIRRCGSTKGRVAHLLYRWRGEPLSVYVLNRRLESGANAGRERHGHEAVSRLGENAIVWSDHGRTYAVVARGSIPDLEQVAGYVRRVIE